MFDRKTYFGSFVVALNWNLPFELMCDATGVALGVVLGQRKDKLFHPIYCASKMFNVTQKNYNITEQELLVLVYTFEKFRAYLLHIDHAALRHLNLVGLVVARI